LGEGPRIKDWRKEMWDSASASTSLRRGRIPFSDVKCGKGQCRKLEDRLEGIKTIKIKEKTYLPSPILHIANFIV